jgi:hypothetical protein
MSPAVQVGTILIEDQLLMPRFGVESEPYSGNWSLVRAPDGLALDREINDAGWNFFFMAPEVKVMVLGALGANKIQNALKRILMKVEHQGFNSLEVTGIVAKHFMGVPYTTVSAHSRHIQQSCYLDGAKQRQASQHDAEWAKG